MFAKGENKRFHGVFMGVALLFVMGCAQQTVKTDEAMTSAAGRSGSQAGAKTGGRSEGSMTEAERSRRRAEFKSGIASLEADRIHFDFDKSSIRPDMRPILDRKAQFLLKFPTVRIQIEGHCDERGTVQYNIALGHRRSQSSRDYLVSLGVSFSRIDTVSYGKERPSDPRHNEEAWFKNRRAKFNVIGGIPAELN